MSAPRNECAIEFVAQTGSTNADLNARVLAGESIHEGQWLVADRQTAGRGRQGRDWFDGAGNFMGSTLVHYRAGDPAPPSLALVAGLAVHAAVARQPGGGDRARLKWPNDVLIGNAKLAGILLEAVGDRVIVGIGVNLAQAPTVPGRETIALGLPAARDSFAKGLADDFAQELARWRTSGLAPIIARWLAAAHPIGTRLRVAEPGAAEVEGAFAGLAADGALQLRLDDGRVRTIHAGDVLLADQR